MQRTQIPLDCQRAATMSCHVRRPDTNDVPKCLENKGKHRPNLWRCALNVGLKYPCILLPTGETRGMKILVVDDHVLIRDAVRGVLKELKGDADVLEASDCRQAMALIAENTNDLGLVLLDLHLPDRDGFSALSEMRERYPAISVVVLSGQHDHSSVMKAFDLGALGFIPKSGQREVMLGALQLIFAGGKYIPPEAIIP